MEIHFAPLQGYTDHLYRRFHALVYGPTDAYYTPFIRMEGGSPRHQDMARLAASAGDGTCLAPQIIFGSFDEFLTLAHAVRDAGYDRIDLNLGCPYPMQTRRGRGAAMIADTATMRRVAEYINGDSAVYSLKMRLGMDRPDEWRALAPIINDTRLCHVTVHPRTARQMYGGELYRDQFMAFCQMSAVPVLWNGDIASSADIDDAAALHPNVMGVMIGRGLLARPSLAAEYNSGVDYDADVRMAKLIELHRLLFEAYCQSLCGDTQVLQRIKPFWDYLEPEIGHKCAKLIRKAMSIARYQQAVAAVGR